MSERATGCLDYVHARPARRRIAIVGAGSAYMPTVIRGLIGRHESLEGSELVFYDIHPERVELVAQLARQMFAVHEANYHVRIARNLEAALEDADFVFTSLRPGGLESRHLDEVIPLKQGVLGQETIGPGGFLMACRSVPALLDIARKMQDVAPTAWLINYTNPTNIVTDAVIRFAGVERIIGLCDQYVGDQETWTAILGLKLDDVEIDWFGTNHNTCARRFRSSAGVDISEDVAKRIAGLEPDSYTDPDHKLLARLALTFGYLVNSYARYYYFHDDIVARLARKSTTRAQDIMKRLPAIYANFAVEAASPNPNPDTSRGGDGWGEFAIDAICAVACDEGRRLVVNTRNGLALPDLEATAIVEVPALVDATGAHPQAMGALPHPARGLAQAVHEYELLAAEAAALGSRRKALQALMAHPLIRSGHVAERILDEGLAAHMAFLPQFQHARSSTTI